MNLNLTLLGEMIGFALFIWLTMKFVWPPLMQAMDERRTRIADGLAAAERSQTDLENAKERAAEILKEAREKSLDIIEHANRRANEIVDEAKTQATTERERQVEAAKADIAQETRSAQEALRKKFSGLAIEAAERIIRREIDLDKHKNLLDEIAARL
ncbi:MAG TPA: F0F1 ATP synthase subunit B [Gammaproteobacteria bacterium]|nr:F0F1 ATP synthase subunit B [Gammaproteobacteria bacterium]HET8551935.1 F0F1 ATP synthase subunit B [Gammaproteobacteria bacterium]